MNQASQTLSSNSFNPKGRSAFSAGSEAEEIGRPADDGESTIVIYEKDPQKRDGEGIELQDSPFIKTALTLQHPLVSQARQVAHEGFRGKMRKTPSGSVLTVEPFVKHLEEAAQLLARVGARPQVVAAAYLHDHIEDLKGWNRERIAIEFTPEVADLVDWVTQQDKSDTWENRQKEYLIRLRLSPEEAKWLSAADKISNMRSYSYLMERGSPVESISKKSWFENSRKYHELLPVFSGNIPPRLMKLYRYELERFDQLGKLMPHLQEQGRKET